MDNEPLFGEWSSLKEEKEKKADKARVERLVFTDWLLLFFAILGGAALVVFAFYLVFEWGRRSAFDEMGHDHTNTINQERGY